MCAHAKGLHTQKTEGERIVQHEFGTLDSAADGAFPAPYTITRNCPPAPDRWVDSGAASAGGAGSFARNFDLALLSLLLPPPPSAPAPPPPPLLCFLGLLLGWNAMSSSSPKLSNVLPEGFLEECLPGGGGGGGGGASAAAAPAPVPPVSSSSSKDSFVVLSFLFFDIIKDLESIRLS